MNQRRDVKQSVVLVPKLCDSKATVLVASPLCHRHPIWLLALNAKRVGVPIWFG